MALGVCQVRRQISELSFLLESLFDVLLAVDKFHFYIVFAVDMFCHALCAVNRAVLASGAPEAYHKVGEAPLDIAFN